MACKQTSKGTKLWYDADGSDPYTQLTGVKSLSGPAMKKDTKDQTSLESTGGWREFCVNFRDGQSMTAQLYSSKTVRNILVNTLFASDEAFYWRITMPLETGESTPGKIEFQGFLIEVGNEVPEDDSIMVPIEVKVTGAVTWTNGS